MSDYKRFVSYVYSYEYGKKNNNVGFVKVDSRNNMCKIIVNFRLAHMPVNYPLKVYFFVRENNNLVGILIGSGKIVGSTYDFREMTNSENIKDSGYHLDDISGIFICDGINKNVVYASEWDNKAIHTEQFMIYKERIREQNISRIEKPAINKPVIEKPVVNKPVINNPTLEVDDKVVELLQDYVNTTQENNTYINEEEIPVIEEKKEEDYEFENKTMEIHSTPKESIWDQLYSKYTKVIGIKDNASYECIKIKPQDLACLPNRYWILGNNSFLLHGFYNYRYLLFAKVNTDNNGTERYKLGIPGIFHKNEKIMASMFGFNEFLEAEQVNKSKETFGYWCMDIQIP